MIKKLSALSVALLLTSSVYASTPDNVLDKTNLMEQTIYGHVQEGAIVDRVGQIELTVTGKETEGQLSDRVDRLYKEVEQDANQTTLKAKVDMIQWTFSGALTKDSLIERMNQLERSVKGRVATGSLESRVNALESVVIGKDKKIVLQSASIPASTVFAIHLNQPLSSQTAKVGDQVPFTVAEDVTDGNLLVVPQGTQGVATVTKVEAAKSFGRKGALDLTFDHITTVAGDTFGAVQGKEAQEKSRSKLEAAGASVAGLAILGPVGLVGGYFVKGKAVDIQPNQTIYVQPSSDVSTYGAGLLVVDKQEVTSANKPTTTDGKSVAKSAADGKASAKEAVADGAAKASQVVFNDAAKAKEAASTAVDSAKDSAKSAKSSAPSQAIVVIKKTS